MRLRWILRKLIILELILLMMPTHVHAYSDELDKPLSSECEDALQYHILFRYRDQHGSGMPNTASIKILGD
jgi:hypothetical protein